MRVLYVTLFVVIFDQVTKFLVKGLKIESLGLSIPGMPYGSSKQVFGNFVKFTFIENPGMAFGVTLGPRILLPMIVLIASVLIVFYLYKHKNDIFVYRISMALILAGALGNLLNRMFNGLIYGYAPFFYGKVVDFVQVEFWDFTVFGKTFTTWPVLNVADISVTAGFLLIVIFNKKIFKLPEESPVNTAEKQDVLKDKSTQAENEINILGSTIN